MKAILISGASSGFGKLTVPLLLEKGHTVIAGVRGGQSRLEGLFSSELQRYPGKLRALDLHLEKSSQFAELARSIGSLDVLINNAGFGLLGVLEDQSEEQIRHQMEINYLGTALLIRAFLPMLRQSRGRILNVSSLAGLAGFPFYGSYSASKFALEGLSECLHYDLKPFGVQVGMIEPGGFKTPFVQARQFGDAQAADSPYRERTKNFEKAFEMTSIRLDDPVKVAKLISKLCDARRVPLRNRIGRDTAFITLIKWLLPERLYLAIVDCGFSYALRAARASREPR